MRLLLLRCGLSKLVFFYIMIVVRGFTMKRIAVCALAAAAFLFASCSVEQALGGVCDTTSALSGTGTNVFVGGGAARGNMIDRIEDTVGTVLDSYGSEENKERLDTAKAEIDEKIGQLVSGDLDVAANDIGEIKDLIVQLLDSITIDQKIQDELLLDVRKASVNEESRKALRDKFSSYPIEEGTPAYDTYYYIMNKLAELLRMMNDGRGDSEEESQYRLWLSEGTITCDMDFAPIFNEISAPTLSDVVMMSMISSTIRSLMKFDALSQLQVADAAPLIGSAIDMYLVADVLRGAVDGEYSGFIGIIQLIVDKFEIKGVLTM